MHTMIKNILDKCHWFVAVMMCCTIISCTQDNVHMPDVEPDTQTWETYAQDFRGTFSTTVPLVQEHLQGPVVSPTVVRLEDFHIEHSGYVTLLTEAFSVNDPFVEDLLGYIVEIGQMRIEKVEYAAFPSGGGFLKKDFDNVKAGAYNTRGTLQGTISKDGHLHLTLTYRPGTMPFDIVTEFE